MRVYFTDTCLYNLSSVFMLLTPLMIISGLLSLKLVRHIEQKEKEKKKKGTSTTILTLAITA